MYNIICFHKPEEPNGFLSNWYMSSFADDEYGEFSSAEQYMMYRKAELFLSCRDKGAGQACKGL